MLTVGLLTVVIYLYTGSFTYLFQTDPLRSLTFKVPQMIFQNDAISSLFDWPKLSFYI